MTERAARSIILPKREVTAVKNRIRIPALITALALCLFLSACSEGTKEHYIL